MYFSRTGENYWRGGRKVLSQGNTAILAKEIAAQTGADTYEIVPARPYSSDYSDTVARNVREERENARPAIANDIPDLSQYSTVYLGSPVWNSQVPMIMRTFVDKANWNRQEVRPFVTHAMSGMAGIDREYGRIIPRSTVTEGLAVLGEDTPADPDSPNSAASDAAKKAVRQWLARLGAPGPASPAAASSATASATPARSQASASSPAGASGSAASRIDKLSYRAHYRGSSYEKKALVYLPAGYNPAGYNPARRYPVLYLIHGSTGSADEMSNGLKDELDKLSTTSYTPPIVVFATYYPDRSFVTSDYTRDAVLNEHFAREELPKALMPLVERTYAVHPSSDSKAPAHRGIGGFSTGGITTWYALRYHPELFNVYLPMAGGAWIPQNGQAGRGGAERGSALVDAVRSRRKAAGLGTKEMKILAGVGAQDGTGSSMLPQIQALAQSGLFGSGNIDFYQAPGEGHSFGAFQATLHNYYGRLFR